jgi:hypothetical protein
VLMLHRERKKKKEKKKKRKKLGKTIWLCYRC